MSVAYFSKVMNSCEQKYAKAEKECLAVLYAVMNFRPFLYGREFILACDYEPIHWITYVENPGARLLRWRLRLHDYQYKFEYKQGVLNRGVEALSANPATEMDSSGSSDSTEDSDDPDESSRSLSPFEREMIRDGSSPSKHSPKKGIEQVLVIHEKTGTGASKPATRSNTSQRKPEDLKDAPRTSSRVLRPTKSTFSGRMFRPVKSKTLYAH